MYYILKLLAVCTLLISCGSETSVSEDDISESSLIHLSLTSNKTGNGNINTRANGTLPTDNGATAGNNEGYINHVCAALFDTSDRLVTLHEYDYARGSTETIVTRKDATRMLVFANVPLGVFSGKYTLNDFYTVSQNLGYTTSVDGKSMTGVTTANSQSMKSLPMLSAVQSLDWSSGAVLNPTVGLTRMVARVALTSLTKTFSGPYSGCSFTPTEVFMYNASNQLTNWSTQTVSGNVSGENTGANANTLYLGSGKISTYSDPYYFYVFPHSSTNPTKLVIKGTFKTNSGSTYTTYYPITVNSSASGNIISAVPSSTGDSKISPNTTYDLSVTLNGTGVANVSDELIPTNVTVTTSVAGYTSATIPEYFGPKIGDILYSDGSCNSSLISGNIPIAIVFSTTTSAADKAKGFVHGYAMALKNVSNSLIWGPEGSTPTGSANTTLDITDYDGLTYTSLIDNTSYPAVVENYSPAQLAPDATSGWYLPSIGQWYQILINLGGMSTVFQDDRKNGTLHWDNSSTVFVNAINAAMNKVGDGNYDPFTTEYQFYWSSSEYDADNAYILLISTSNSLGLTNIGKSDNSSVRRVIAF
ncbi:fimbrial protein [Xylanibacter oryzae]|uniref:fimbrial protein n=1 Tax=Xylanibacter oryzae TaxID=185293 RepID=UPI0012B56D75|nr:fimbrial protein [Xylanibacter oryzae]